MSSKARIPIRRDDAIHALVRNVVDTRYGDLSQKAVDATKTFILELGHPDKPLSREQHLEKFRACWAEGAAHLPASNRDRLVNLVEGLEREPSLDELIRLLVP